MKMLHVTIQTDKFDEEIRFYEEQVGLRIQEDMRSIGRKIVFLAEEAQDTKIEIIENPQAFNAGNANLSVGFATEDLDKKYNLLKEAGYTVTDAVALAQYAVFLCKRSGGRNHTIYANLKSANHHLGN